MDNKNVFWINDITILYKDNNYLKFFPDATMTRIEQLNAMTRLSIYSFILILIFYGESRWLYIPIILFILIIVLYYIYIMDPQGKEKELYRQKGEKFTLESEDDDNNIVIESGYYDADGNLRLGAEYTNGKKIRKINYDMSEMMEYERATCRKPTPDNPFMNTPVTDYNKEDVPSACNADDEDIKEQIDDNFYKNLYRDVGDLFGVKNSQRMFYTVQQVPGDQINFANWLYAESRNCKTDQQNCLLYEDLRKVTQF